MVGIAKVGIVDCLVAIFPRSLRRRVRGLEVVVLGQ